MAKELTKERLSGYRAAVAAGFYNEGGPGDPGFSFRDAQTMITVGVYRLTHQLPQSNLLRELGSSRGVSTDSMYVPTELTTTNTKYIAMDWSE